MFKVIQKKHIRASVYKSPAVLSYKKTEIILTAWLIGGFILSVWALRNNPDWLDRLSTLFSNFYAVKKEQSFLSGYFTALSAKAFPLVFVYICGLCAVGAPFILSVPFGIGLILGVISGYLYASFSLQGIGYCALIVFPGAVPASVLIIIACCFSMQMSRKILKCLSPKEQTSDFDFRSYCTHFLLLFLVAGIISLLDILLFQLFSGYFQF